MHGRLRRSSKTIASARGPRRLLGVLGVAVVLAAHPSAPAAEPPSVRFTWHDAATHAGRSTLTFRGITLSDTPVSPVTHSLGPGTRYGLLRVGPAPATALAVVWNPKAPGGARLGLDADGDGRITPAECHTLNGPEVEVPVDLPAPAGAPAGRWRRTLIVRRSSVDDGLRYAIRGHAAGTLTLGGTAYPALLTDGDADGCFDGVGVDRVWIDLARDGRFDPFTEQFPLGSPISLAGEVYLVRSDALAADVRVRARSTERGAVRLSVAGQAGVRPTRLSAQLVSTVGELVPVTAEGQRVELPADRYRVASLDFELRDDRGQTWAYHFVGGERYDIEVRAGEEALAEPLRTLAMAVTATAPEDGRTSVTPRLRTPAGLYLSDCILRASDTQAPRPCTADVVLRGPGGAELDRAASGFN